MFDQNKSAPFFDPEWMFGVTAGFDILIANPPYVSTKDVTENEKKIYVQEFGFSDDLYNLFTFKGLSLCSEGGSITYITPKTFWTTQTKRNMRDLLLSHNLQYVFDSANPFKVVMVDTCIWQVIKHKFNSKKDNLVYFYDGSKDLSHPNVFAPIKQSVYREAQNSVIFKPTKINLEIFELYGEKVKEGLCWSDINTTFLKCRKKQCSVNDVKSMSLYGVSAIVPEDYIITLLNSTFFSYYVDTFVNNTQTFQINDARQLPVIVPTLDTIERTHILLRRAVAIKQQAGPHEDSLLEKLQKEVDTLVLKIYGLTP